jgi:hypothetical protein
MGVWCIEGVRIDSMRVVNAQQRGFSHFSLRVSGWFGFWFWNWNFFFPVSVLVLVLEIEMVL